MLKEVTFGILLPFFGTVLGAAGVFFMKKRKLSLQIILSGFAAGVMTAASVWSLLMPSIDSCAHMGKAAFLPALTGLIFGLFVLTFLDRQVTKITKRLESGEDNPFSKSLMSFLAVTIHNFPEGMAVGMIYASLLSGAKGVTASSALTLATAIALQNIPEGAIISLPLHSEGMKKGKSFFWGAVSGIVEPLGAVLTLIATGFAGTFLPYLFGFAAGAMLFVVADELIIKREDSDSLPLSALSFGFGFSLMMVMDVALG